MMVRLLVLTVARRGEMKKLVEWLLMSAMLTAMAPPGRMQGMLQLRTRMETAR
jgi:hypothetical protein